MTALPAGRGPREPDGTSEQEFYDLARKYRVTGVPKTVVNESIEILGALPEPDFVRAALGIEEQRDQA